MGKKLENAGQKKIDLDINFQDFYMFPVEICETLKM
jgi:hypothetical protein